MNWGDERYVRLYTRNTVEWNMWPWQSRALFPLLSRAVDRAGLLELGRHGAKGLAVTVALPVEVVEPGLAGLVEDGCVVVRGTILIIRNHIQAQEAKSSDAQRKRDEREKHRDLANTPVTVRDLVSQDVTKSHDVSQPVTSGHDESLCTVLSVPSEPLKNLVGPKKPDATGLALEPTEPAKKRGRRPKTENPPPYTYAEWESVLSASGRWISVEPTGPQKINVHKQIRAISLADLGLIAIWLKGGGDEFRGKLDVRCWQNVPAWLGHAREWAASGKRQIARSQPAFVAPEPSRAPSPVFDLAAKQREAEAKAVEAAQWERDNPEEAARVHARLAKKGLA